MKVSRSRGRRRRPDARPAGKDATQVKKEELQEEKKKPQNLVKRRRQTRNQWLKRIIVEMRTEKPEPPPRSVRNSEEQDRMGPSGHTMRERSRTSQRTRRAPGMKAGTEKPTGTWPLALKQGTARKPEGAAWEKILQLLPELVPEPPRSGLCPARNRSSVSGRRCRSKLGGRQRRR